MDMLKTILLTNFNFFIMAFETGFKYILFLKTEKWLAGAKRTLVRGLYWGDTLQETTDIFNNMIITENRMCDYYIAKYDISGREVKKIGEYSLQS